MLKKRIVAMILTAVMTITAVNFLPGGNARAEEQVEVTTETATQTATDTDAEQQLDDERVGAMVDALPLMQLQPGGVGVVKVTALNTVTASGSSFSSFSLSNGAIGFCTNHAARALGSQDGEINTYDYAYFDLASAQVGLSADQQAKIKKVFYYGYNGLANQLSGYSENNQIAYTVDAMQYVVCGTSYISGNPLINYLGSGWAGPPSSTMSFSAATWNASVDSATGKQKTSNITFNADVRVNCNLTLASGMELYFISSQAGKSPNVANTGTVSITGGDVFYLTMPESTDIDWTGSVSANFMTNVYEVHSDSWARSGSGVQGIMFATYGNNSASFTVNFAPQLGSVEIVKSSAYPAVTNGNNCYSLQGAVYGIYGSCADANAGTNAVASITTDVNGYGKADNLAYGTYYIKETAAPSGFALDGTVYSAAVNSSTAVKLSLTDIPHMDPVRVLLTKENEAGTRLAGAEYTFKFYPEQMDKNPAQAGKTPARTWVLKTNENGVCCLDAAFRISGDDFYYGPTGSPYLPLGTLTIQETKAPEGYVLDNTVYVRQITSSGYAEAVNTYNAPTVVEHEIRGDLAFTKKDVDTKEPLGNVKFTITSESTGESHTVWTDENGYYSTDVSFTPHSENTNLGNAGCGIWFGSETVDDSKGALPYGSYTIKEQRCDANKNKYKDLAAFTMTITEHGTVVDYGDVYNEKFPTIRTEAWDTTTKSNIAAYNGTIYVTDTCCLENLEVGHNYVIKGKVMLPDTGKELIQNGDTVIAEKKFTATASMMEVDVDGYVIDTNNLAGRDIVLFEYLYDEAYPDEVIAREEDLYNLSQTIHIPEIHTYAKDSVSYTHDARRSSSTTIVDTVSFSNLISGKKYHIEGILYDYDTNEPLEVDGKTVTAELDFVPEEDSGMVDMQYTFKSLWLHGKRVVVFEYLYMDDVLVAVHADIEDEGQTVTFDNLVGYLVLDTISSPSSGGWHNMNNSPQTGDSTKPYIIFSVMSITFTCLCILVIKSRRKRGGKKSCS